MVLADDEVYLQVAVTLPAIHDGRAFIDGHEVRDAAPVVVPAASGVVLGVSLAQMGVQVPATFLVGPDMPVDVLYGGAIDALVTAPAHDLIWTQVLSKETLHTFPMLVVVKTVDMGGPGSLRGFFLGSMGVVALLRTVPVDLAGDGALGASHLISDEFLGATCIQQALN